MENGKMYDPELSEFNPICAEFQKIKEKILKEEDTNIFASIIAKICFYKIVAHLD